MPGCSGSNYIADSYYHHGHFFPSAFMAALISLICRLRSRVNDRAQMMHKVKTAEETAAMIEQTNP